LLAILAASLTVEAGYSVRGETGGLLAGGIVVATVAWYPGFAAWPYDNPNFGMMFFLAALSACLAVLSGHRQWWPVLVATASIAAQAYLTYVGVSVGLVLIAVVVGLADGFRAKGGYGWLIAGLAAGAACWIAPLVQQFTSPAGKGNMSLLLHGDEGRQVGFAFAMKVMASFAAPSSLWWRESLNWWPDLYQKITSRPAALGFVILAITAAGLVIAVRWLRSRELAGLAAISLLVSVTAAAVFARIPVQAFAVHGAGGFQHLVNDVPLIFVMFIAALLPWLTVICVTALAVVKLISDRRLTPLLVRGTAALLIVMTALLVLVVQSVENYAGTG
jgi:succinate dehydrogenase/fumarate reductase cytochrome b subunit